MKRVDVMTSTKLCLSTLRYYPVFSGAALRFMRYLPGLKSRGIDPVVFTATPTLDWAEASGVDAVWRSAPLGTVLPPEFIDDIPIYRVRLPDTESKRRQAQYARALLDFSTAPSTRPDVIQHLSLKAWHIPWVYRLKQSGIPMLYAYTLVTNLPRNPLMRVYLQQESKIRYHLMDHVIVSSSVVEELLRSQNVTAPITSIPNGVDLVRYHPPVGPDDRRKIRAAYGIPDDAPTIIAIGAVHPRKGTDLIVAAWSRLVQSMPNAHLMVVGPRIDAADPTLQDFGARIDAAIHSAGAPDQIHFAGHVDNVEEYLRAADLFLFASQREGFGNVVLEAMATELPVVTTPYEGLPDEFGQPGREYILVRRDVAVIAAAVEELLRDRTRSQTLGQDARQWVETHMSVEGIMDRFAELYHRTASTRGTVHESGPVLDQLLTPK